MAKNFFGSKSGDRFYFENGHDLENKFTPEQPNALVQSMAEEGEFEEIDGSCPYVNVKRPKNDVVDCALLAQLDFTLWKDYTNGYAYSELLYLYI